MTLIKMAEHCYAECHWYWVSLILSVIDTECHWYLVSLILSVIDTECHWSWVSLILSVIDTECHWYWVSLILSVIDTECHWCWVSHVSLICWVSWYDCDIAQWQEITSAVHRSLVPRTSETLNFTFDKLTVAKQNLFVKLFLCFCIYKKWFHQILQNSCHWAMSQSRLDTKHIRLTCDTQHQWLYGGGYTRQLHMRVP